MVAQPPISFLDFLLVIAVSSLENVGTFPNVLTSTFLTGPEIDYKGTVTVQSLFNWICSLCVSACELLPLL